MSLSILKTEMLRARWARVRGKVNLLDPKDEMFGATELGGRVTERSLRLLILPNDPEASLVEFDEQMWDWWTQERPFPATGATFKWSNYHIPTSETAAMYHQEEDGWADYLALHRCGALELELGVKALFLSNEKRWFKLLYSVGRIWFALSVFAEITKRYPIGEPCEVTVALQNVRNTYLGNVAEGWADFNEYYDGHLPCQSLNAIVRREFNGWSSPDEIQDLAFKLGGWIEDTWGYPQRRFINRSGANIGQIGPLRLL